jgi:hypothetical protein
MGDLQTSHPNEAYPALGNLIDLWYADQDGFTYSWVRNAMIRDRYQSRLDRIYLGCIDWDAVQVERFMKLLGTEPISRTPPIWPALHFGLFLVLELVWEQN